MITVFNKSKIRKTLMSDGKELYFPPGKSFHEEIPTVLKHIKRHEDLSISVIEIKPGLTVDLEPEPATPVELKPVIVEDAIQPIPNELKEEFFTKIPVPRKKRKSKKE